MNGSVRQTLLESAERHVTALRAEREEHWQEIAQLRRVVAAYRLVGTVLDDELRAPEDDGYVVVLRRGTQLRALLAAAQREDT